VFLVALRVEVGLWAGGLAPLAVAATIAAFVGLPLARAEWRLGPDPQARTRPLGETLVLIAVAAVIGEQLAHTGVVALLVLVVGWPLVYVAVSRFGHWAAAIAAAAATLWTLGVAGFCWVRFAGITLLEPHWETWQQWLPWSITAGLLLATAGLGRWAEAPDAIPGYRKVPWASAGLGLLVTLAACVVVSTVVEGSPSTRTLAIVAGPMAVALCAAALEGSPGGGRRRLGIGLAASLWFAGPGMGGLAVFWRVLLPLGLAANIGALALRARGQVRVTAWVGSVLAVVAAWLGWPGIPLATLDAAAAAMTLVGLVWIVGTRGVLGGRQTA